MDAARGGNLPPSFFELVRSSELPVLVDFWAEWCGPCRMVSPAIERLAREFSGKILTIKVNIDKRPNIAETCQIDSIPTIMLFWKGKPRMRLTGAYPFDVIRKNLVESLPKETGQATA